MTVCYNEQVATARPFGFLSLLLRWKGSFYKLVIHQFVLYLSLYTSLTLVYAFLLDEGQRAIFDRVGIQLGHMSGYVVSSVSLCLSFFMQQVYKRWWANFQQVPWPDSLAFYITAYVTGSDKRGRLIRRTMVRYAVASIVLALLCVSKRLTLMFPELDYVVVAGFLTDNEVRLLRDIKPAWRHMIPLTWCAALVRRARVTENRIEDDFGYNAILHELDRIRYKCRRLMHYNNFPVPLAYLHTVILAVYSFFTTAAVAGSHRSDTEELHDELLVGATLGELLAIRFLSEMVTLLQFAICAGMLAATEALIAPFGNNDGDFETDVIVKRHLGTSYLIVDDMFSMIPELTEAEPVVETNKPPVDHLHIFRQTSRQGSSHSHTSTRRSSAGQLNCDHEDREGLEILFKLSQGFYDNDETVLEAGHRRRIRTWAPEWFQRVPLLRRLVRDRRPTSAPAALTDVTPNIPREFFKKSLSTNTPPDFMRLLSFRRLN